MSVKSKSQTTQTPDQLPLSKQRVQMLSSLTGIDAAEFANLSIAEISSKFRWRIDPELFLFRQICGQVVKPDPSTGANEPVPFATVYAEDTVCSMLGYFPIDHPWSWFFPFWCETEVVAETTTDACGNFCVWVPAFEIEWILRFRIERLCYLDIFAKPTVGSVLQYLQGKPFGPGVGFDATTLATLKPGTALYQRAEQVLGTTVTRQLSGLGNGRSLGSRIAGQQSLLASSGFRSLLPPALPREFRTRARGISLKDHKSAVRSTVASNLGIEAEALQNLDLASYCGPFLRCYDIIVPEWYPIFEVPAISFRVTQDVNGTGVPEVIYAGSPFDVTWSSGDIADVTLTASPIALSVASCNTPGVTCGNVPSLEFVGLMPLINPHLPAAPYVDPVAGFATRPNPPHPSIGTTNPGGTLAGPGVPPATAPYTGTLQLYGCTQVTGAVYYRLRYTYTGSGPTSALAPFTGLTWPLYREVAGNLEWLWPVSDASGWYPVLPTSDDWFPNNMVLEWDTTKFADGLYSVQLEVGDASKNVLATSAAVGFVVDNSLPIVTYSGTWSFSADMSGSQPFPTDDCAVIERGVTPVPVYVQVTFSVTAQHLRSLELDSWGCNGGAQLTSAVSTTQHWYEDAGDNAFSSTASYTIPASFQEGVYSFDVWAASRAFNPAGSDEGPLDDWNYNPSPNWTEPSFSIAIVNA